jgi:soluble lytic murein transglycosylase-like protein
MMFTGATRAVWIVLTLAVPAFAGESAVLASGLRLHVDRHEESDGMVRLYRGEGVTVIPKSFVRSFEPDEPDTPVLAPPPAAEQPTAAPAAKPPKAPEAPDPRALVRAAAARAGLPAAFVESVAKTESGFDPAAVSPKGAIGVMQLMPATAKALGADANDPAQNIDAGARLLRELLLKYDGDVVKALAAYNAGETAVDRYQGVPPYPETQHYVNTVVGSYIKSPEYLKNNGQ